MKADTLQIVWHAKKPVFSVDIHPVTQHLATGGADNDVKIWSIVRGRESDPSAQSKGAGAGAAPSIQVEFVANLVRHSKAVNCVRFAPTSQPLLASSSDDGLIILWQKNEQPVPASEPPGPNSGSLVDDDGIVNKESWTVRSVLRLHIEDVLDLCWSPDASCLISGSVDNTVALWDVTKAKPLHHFKDHKHYVQGVAWDPLNKFVASQSSDRTVQIYSVVEKEEKRRKPTAAPATALSGPAASTSATAPPAGAAPDSEDAYVIRKRREAKPFAAHTKLDFQEYVKIKAGDAAEDAAAIRDSESEVDKSASAKAHPGKSATRLYHDETLPSFFRRLAFTRDGSLLLTPGGLGSSLLHPEKAPKHSSSSSSSSSSSDGAQESGSASASTAAPGKSGADDASSLNPRTIIHTVYGFARSALQYPLFDLQALSKPAVVVKCSPVLFELRETAAQTPAQPVFLKLPYRMVIAVATLDTVFLYDTQQLAPFAMFSNLHFAPLTDLAWASDSNLLFMSSQDGYCSYISFEDGELGTPLAKSKYPPHLAVDVSDNENVLAEEERAKRPDELALHSEAEPMRVDSGEAGQPSAPAVTLTPVVNDITNLIKRKPVASVPAASAPVAAAPPVNDISHLVRKAAKPQSLASAQAPASTAASTAASTTSESEAPGTLAAKRSASDVDDRSQQEVKKPRRVQPVLVTAEVGVSSSGEDSSAASTTSSKSSESSGV